MIRNLVYYAYFNIGNIPKYISQHIYLLKHYIDIFNGEKIIYIATDDEININTINKLKSYFSFTNATIKVVKNNPNNRESEYFIGQLEDLQKIKKDNSITFYAHTKGSTYDENNCILKWILSMYFFNLENDNLLNIDNKLKDNLFSGIFRIDNPCPPWVFADWHYSGTFFWFNTDNLFSTDWKSGYKDRFFVESYPGLKCNISQSILSEDLFNIYAKSFLPIGYDRHDLRYNFYWDNIFSKGLISTDKLIKFNNLLNKISEVN